MHLTRDMADAFGDWLERDQIQRALVAARPELAGAMIPDEDRPLLRIPRPGGGALIVARIFGEAAARWVVGIPDRSTPTLYEAASSEEVIGIVLGALERPNNATQKEEDSGDQG